MKYVFLGNYVGRGRQSLEIVMGLFCLKMLYPDRIFLLRGNHEFIKVNVEHGFPLEIKERYIDMETITLLYAHVNTAFCYLSVAAIVGNKYFCAHAGISTAGCTRRLVRKVLKPYLLSQLDFSLHDMMWSDPANGLRSTMFNAAKGTSIVIGVDAMAYALYNMDCIGLIRGDTPHAKGYDYVGEICISLFSCVGLTNNKGSIAHIDSEGGVTIKVFEIDHARVAWDSKLLQHDAASYEKAATVVG